MSTTGGDTVGGGTNIVDINNGGRTFIVYTNISDTNFRDKILSFSTSVEIEEIMAYNPILCIKTMY